MAWERAEEDGKTGASGAEAIGLRWGVGREEKREGRMLGRRLGARCSGFQGRVREDKKASRAAKQRERNAKATGAGNAAVNDWDAGWLNGALEQF